ncbi:MAG: hypothetical protein KAI24_06715, partial [Planctomycetes bacterium]|nr:hypothetical protein [Planctomycetota bacterium]
RHLRGDRTAAEQAAEMAWLSGAGESAVLLDAGLRALVAAEHDRRPDRDEVVRVWRRVAAADAHDSPASIALQLAIEGRFGLPTEFDPTQARTLPAPHRAGARDWFVAAAGAAIDDARVRLLRVAVTLGAEPDFTREPWASLAEAPRRLLQTEARDDGR